MYLIEYSLSLGYSFTLAKQMGWLVESDTAYGPQGKAEEEICEFGCVGLI